MSELSYLSLTKIRDMLRAKEISAQETMQASLDRIAATEPKCNAMVTVLGEQALEQAKKLDSQGPDSAKPLWGVPVAVKDLITLKGVTNTCGSRILHNFKPFYNAFCVDKILDAGSVVVGKTNMDEFAMGSTTESSCHGPTKNPWDLERIPGGSSGGAAAGVAAGQVYASIGTDTGGSIRQPASLCGCVGLKPTYGRISRYGLVAYGSSLDQAGPLTRTVEDAALMLQVMAGHDSKDATCSKVEVPDYLGPLQQQDLKGVRIGMPKEFFGDTGSHPEVQVALDEALTKAKDLGAELVPVSLPHTAYAVATYYIIAMAEASSNLARFDGVRYGHRAKDPADLIDMYVKSRSEGFGDEVQRRIIIGTYVLSAGYYDAYYRKAAQVRRLIRQDFLDAFESCDVICGPVSPVTAWKLGELIDDPLKMYLMDIFTLPVNLAGLPGLSLPVGLGAQSQMPVGMHLIGKAFKEDRLLSIGHALEQALPQLGVPRGMQG